MDSFILMKIMYQLIRDEDKHIIYHYLFCCSQLYVYLYIVTPCIGLFWSSLLISLNNLLYIKQRDLFISFLYFIYVYDYLYKIKTDYSFSLSVILYFLITI